MTEQWTLHLDIREFRPDEYERLAQVYASLFPDYERTPGEWRFEDESLDQSKYRFKRYTCASPDTGEILGFGQRSHAGWMYNPKKFWLEIWVHPKHQGKGIGTAICQRLIRDLESHGATTAWSGVKEDMASSVHFAVSRGFREKMRAWESRLDPSRVSLSDYQKYLENVSYRGIQISPLSQETLADPDCYPKVHDLEQSVAEDIPRPEPFTPLPYEQWIAMVMKNPNLAPEGYMIAKDGNRYVGMSTVWRSQKEPKGLYQGLTGVRREYRGRGIAMALKLKVLEFAKRNGYERIKTWNDSTNTGMLAINHRLGFKRQVGWITFEKNLA